MRNPQGPSAEQIRENRVYLLSLLLFLILMPVPLTGNLPVALVAGSMGAGIGALCVFRRSDWWLLLIPLWWFLSAYGANQLSTHTPLLNFGDLHAISLLHPPILGYYVARGIIVFEHSNIPRSSYYVQWSDGEHNKDHINDPTPEQILAEFDKLDGSQRSTLRIRAGLQQVDICVLTDDLTLFYHTNNHKTHTFMHAVYSPGYTQEGEYYGPIGGYPHATFDLYVFITRADSRRLLEEFLATGQRPQAALWLDCETDSQTLRPQWN